MESRILKMEESLDSIKTKQSGDQVGEALRNVRALAIRPNLTSPSILLAALEVLVDHATKSGHKEADYYARALQTCRKFENNPDICSLCLKLLGSCEDKKVSSAVADWVKSRKYDGSKENVAQGSDKVVPQQFNFSQPYPCFPYGMPVPGQVGPTQLPLQQMPATGFSPPYFPMRPQFPRARFQNRRGNPGAGVCFFCKSQGHFVANCPHMKRE